MRAHWKAEDGVLVFDGKGDNLCTQKLYGDFEMYVDWKIDRGGDSGIYLRGSPQVQIWDNKIGSGGLYNNQKKENPHDPPKKMDKPIGQWNSLPHQDDRREGLGVVQRRAGRRQCDAGELLGAQQADLRP